MIFIFTKKKKKVFCHFIGGRKIEIKLKKKKAFFGLASHLACPNALKRHRSFHS